MSGMWVAVAGVVVAVVGLVLFVVLMRRLVVYRPLAAADRETRKAVARAIRTGVADDPRVAELARGLAWKMPRLRWAPWFVVPFVGLQGYVLVERIRDRDHRGWLTAAVICFVIFVWAMNVVQQRRFERFRTGESGRPQSRAT